MDEIIDRMKSEIKSILVAYPIDVTKQALRELSTARREERVEQGWMLWVQEGFPPKPYEWRQLGNSIQYRMPDTDQVATMRSRAERQPGRIPDQDHAAKHCPDCGAEAFAQAVCPACAKGKAGIRKMYVCGENSDHVFYTE